MLFFRSFVTCHERATAWLFHVGASQNYCVSHLSSRRSDSGPRMQVPFFFPKTILTWGQFHRAHTWGRRSAPQLYSFLCPFCFSPLCTYYFQVYNTHPCHRPAQDKSRRSEPPQSTQECNMFDATRPRSLVEAGTTLAFPGWSNHLA